MRNFPSYTVAASAAVKLLQLCPTLCNPRDSSPPDSIVPGILQAKTLEWVAISFSNAWKWKWSRSVVSDSSRPHGLQPTRLLGPWNFPGKSTGVGCHCLLCPSYAPLSKHCTIKLIVYYCTTIPRPPKKGEREKSNYLRASSLSFPRTQNASFWSLPWIPFRVYYRSVTAVANDLILTELEGGLVFILKSLPFQSAFQWMFERHFVTNLYHSTRNAHSQTRLGLPC